MYIRRKVFSVLNVENEEKLFSTNEINRTSLESIDSNRGLGRALGVTLVTGNPASLIGGYAAKGAAEKADAEGKSDIEIISAGKKRAGKIGAISGAALGGLLLPKKLKVGGALVGAGLGYLGSRWAGGKNVEDRLKQRNKIDQSRKIFSEEEKFDNFGDKVDHALLKYAHSKKDREAIVEAFENQNFTPLRRRGVKMSAAGGALGGGLMAKGLGASNRKAAAVATTGAVTMAGANFIGSKLGEGIHKTVRKKSPAFEKRALRVADLAKVADGKMSKSEFNKKYKD